MHPAPAATLTSSTSPPGVEWASVYREHFKPVWRFLARLGVQPSELEDLAHEVFLTAFKRADAFDPSRPVLPWLFGIAYRLASDHRQRAGSTREEVVGEVPDTAEISGPTAEKAVLARQARVLLDEVLESMDLEKRAVFVMHEFDGLTVPDIARTIDVPVATAYSRLRLAREQFDAGVKRVRARVSHESIA